MTPFLSPELTTIALCWRLDRRDGVSLGFTGHDRDIIIAGLPYRAAPGMLPSAISLSDGFDVDTLDISGALSADAISADDLAAGRWDGARVRLFAIDWTDADGAVLPLARGELGDVGLRDGGFTAELRGPTALLERPVVEQTSPECRAELGDRRCRVDMAGRRTVARIVAAGGASLTLDRAENAPGSYAYGRLRWIDGANSGIATAILASSGTTLTLRDPPSTAAAIGDHVELIEGCDKAFATCRARFANMANFRGEPHLAGNDLLTRYPGA
ncbi:DUF2163 domain-containing protein [Sphingomonas profundi]|uniref:DUF2163 domain-containing protein n=1 Tax=Alterirhizorhabdus profundi TaxID=2681549 RepID=UPI0012E70D9F|nr:DUF2163 domain-containing protein [Sphingomonas profundi]